MAPRARLLTQPGLASSGSRAAPSSPNWYVLDWYALVEERVLHDAHGAQHVLPLLHAEGDSSIRLPYCEFPLLDGGSPGDPLVDRSARPVVCARCSAEPRHRSLRGAAQLSHRRRDPDQGHRLLRPRGHPERSSRHRHGPHLRSHEARAGAPGRPQPGAFTARGGSHIGLPGAAGPPLQRARSRPAGRLRRLRPGQRAGGRAAVGARTVGYGENRNARSAARRAFVHPSRRGRSLRSGREGLARADRGGPRRAVQPAELGRSPGAAREQPSGDRHPPGPLSEGLDLAGDRLADHKGAHSPGEPAGGGKGPGLRRLQGLREGREPEAQDGKEAAARQRVGGPSPPQPPIRGADQARIHRGDPDPPGHRVPPPTMRSSAIRPAVSSSRAVPSHSTGSCATST